MPNVSQWDDIAAAISRATGCVFYPNDRRSVGGGCINSGYQLTDGARSYFVKLNTATKIEMFAAEMAGLQVMQATGTIRVPTPVGYDVTGDTAFLVLEWLELGSGSSTAWTRMGEQLAAMHRSTCPQGFGWERSNTIGATPQPNLWMADWAEFWCTQRIEFQLQLARRRGGNFPQGDRLLATIPKILAGHHPQPSLVHGDLWSGNAAITQSGEPVIFDPATYYGDREVDLAMTELFGRFPHEFYQAYDAAYPLVPGYDRRKVLYNLYHILNHFNLFGGGYDSQANAMVDRLLS
jgi:fructosamine-3-kinase